MNTVPKCNKTTFSTLSSHSLDERGLYIRHPDRCHRLLAQLAPTTAPLLVPLPVRLTTYDNALQQRWRDNVERDAYGEQKLKLDHIHFIYITLLRNALLGHRTR